MPHNGQSHRRRRNAATIAVDCLIVGGSAGRAAKWGNKIARGTFKACAPTLRQFVIVCLGLVSRAAGMIVGPAVPQNPSGQWLIALRRHHEGGAVVRRSANACLLAYLETRQACSGFRRVAFGSFVISQARADVTIPVGSHRQADSSDGRRTVARRHTAW